MKINIDTLYRPGQEVYQVCHGELPSKKKCPACKGTKFIKTRWGSRQMCTGCRGSGMAKGEFGHIVAGPFTIAHIAVFFEAPTPYLYHFKADKAKNELEDWECLEGILFKTEEDAALAAKAENKSHKHTQG